MENEIFDFLEIIRKVKRVDNFNIALMDKEELKAYLVAQMVKIEEDYPDIVEHIEPSGFNEDFQK